MAQLAEGRVIGNEIIILVVPAQMPRADAVPRAAAPQCLLLVHIPLEVFETDLPPLRKRGVQLVHIVINALVHGFHATRDQNLPL